MRVSNPRYYLISELTAQELKLSISDTAKEFEINPALRSCVFRYPNGSYEVWYCKNPTHYSGPLRYHVKICAENTATANNYTPPRSGLLYTVSVQVSDRVTRSFKPGRIFVPHTNLEGIPDFYLQKTYFGWDTYVRAQINLSHLSVSRLIKRLERLANGKACPS